MRKALFCVVLVAASFAGGAVVNGPGLNWAKAMVIDRLGLADSGDNHSALPSDSIPPLAVEPSEVIPNVPGMNNMDVGPDRKDAFPNKSNEQIAAILNGQDHDRAETRSAPKTASDQPERGHGKAPARSDATASTTPHEPDPLAEVKAKAKLLPTLAPVPATAPALETDPVPLPLADATTPKSTSTGSDSDEAVKPLPNELTDTARKSQSGEPTDAAVNPTGRQPSAGGAGEWAEIRRLLKTAGVSRYGIEGEPGGRVRFQCVIPLAGRRAVGQHFEAEGDDEIQAARAVLKRIMLWRATGDQSDAP